MEPSVLLMGAVVMFACVWLNGLSQRVGMPYLLAFVGLGMFFGSDGVVRIPFSDFRAAEAVCSAALIFIMFYGGFSTNWKQGRGVALPAMLLSSLGVLITAAITGLFCRLVLRFGWVESFLIASVVSSTDAASVFAILRSKKLNLKYGTSSLLEIESGSNDPMAYMLTAACIALMRGEGGAGRMLGMLGLQIALGLLIGLGLAWLNIAVLRHIRLPNEGFHHVYMTGVALLSYALAERLGGNGYLSAYLVGLVTGNSDIPDKKEQIHYMNGLTSICQMVIFFLLGLLSFPSRLPAVAVPAVLIALCLLLVARPAAVFLLGRLSGLRANQMLMVSWAGLRGASSAVFAIVAVTAVSAEHDLYHIAFLVVLISILLQGSLMSQVGSLLGMVDQTGDVMKTFNDYSDELPVEFIQMEIPEGHAWAGLRLRELQLPPSSLVVMITRGHEKLIPHGDTQLLAGDVLALAAVSARHMDSLHLTELRVEAGSEFAGLPLRELPPEKRGLVIVLVRGSKTFVPDGSTVLREGDLLVIHHRGDERTAARETPPSPPAAEVRASEAECEAGAAALPETEEEA